MITKAIVNPVTETHPSILIFAQFTFLHTCPFINAHDFLNPPRSTEDNGGHTAGVVALALGQSAAEGTLKHYMISASRDGTMGVFQTSDGATTYKHKCGEGATCLGVFDPPPGNSALLLVGYEVSVVFFFFTVVISSLISFSSRFFFFSFFVFAVFFTNT